MRSVRRQRSFASSASSGASAHSDFDPARLRLPPPATLRVKTQFYRRPATNTALHPPSTPTLPLRRRNPRLPRCLFRLQTLNSPDTNTKPNPDEDDDVFRVWTSPPAVDRSVNRARAFLQCLEAGSDPIINLFFEECRRGQVTPCPIRFENGCLRSEGYEMTDAHCVPLRHLLNSYKSDIASIDLTRNSIAYKGAILLANASSNLSSLVLADNKLERYGAFVWAQFVSQSECRLLSMNLARNNIGSYGAVLLQKGLVANRTLISLNVSSNHLGNEGARAISQLLSTTETLRVLDVGRNHISSDGAAFLASALERNASLTALIVPWSSLKGSAGILMAVALMAHRRLRRADLRYCDVEPEAGIVLAHAIRINSRIQQLLLSGNPISWAGRTIVWAAITSIGLGRPHLSMTECDMKLPVDEPSIRFDPFDPNALYTLDLSNPVQYSIAAEAFALAEQPGVCMMTDFTLNGESMITVSDLDREHPWLLLPQQGVARFNFEWYPAPVHHSAGRISLSQNQFNIILGLINDPDHNSDAHRLDLLFEICSAFFFDRRQLLEIVRSFQPGSEARTSAAALFAVRYLPSQDDQQTIQQMLSTGEDPVLSAYESGMVGAITHGFNALNPSGHYTLDLSNRIDMIICRTLAQISGWQSYRRDPGAVSDWSQCGQRHLWRNVTVDGVASSSLLDCLRRRLPHGIVEFDFVLRIRPDAAVSPMLAVPFLELVRIIDNAFESLHRGAEHALIETCSGQLSSALALTQLRQACIHNYFLEEQTHVLLGCFPDNELRVDAFIILYGRIIDEIGVRRLASAMFSNAGQHNVMRRMGYTALWSPFNPFPSYSLDLSHTDARVLLKLILCLCLVEERCDIADIFYNGILTNIPSLWLSQPPLQGLLQFRLNFASNLKPNVFYRERVASIVLSWEADVVRQASEEMKPQNPVFDMTKHRRKRMPSLASNASSTSVNGSKRAPSLPPVLHARFEQDQEI